MAPKVTSSSDRSTRKPKTPKPITQGQNPQRANRQKVSKANVTDTNTRGSNAGSAKVTTGRGASAPKPADPWNGAPAKNSRTSAPKDNTTFRTGNTPITLPNSQRAGAVLPKIGAQVERSTTQGPTLRGSKPPAKPTGKFKAPDIPKPPAKPPAKPSAKPSLRGALRGAVGRGNALILGLSAANAVQDSLMTPEQRKRKAEAELRPITMADMPGQGGGSRGVRTGTASGRTGRGGTTADVRAAAPAKPRVSNIPPAEGTGRGGPSDIKRTQPKPPTRSNGGNPPAPGSTRRQPSSGGGSSTSSRPSRPQTSTGTAGKGQQWADFNPNRGTSKSNNPLLDREGGFLRQRMKDREATQQAGDAQKVGNKFDTKSDLITPTTKVDGSNLDTKKIDQKKVDEYKRRKNGYYD